MVRGQVDVGVGSLSWNPGRTAVCLGVNHLTSLFRRFHLREMGVATPPASEARGRVTWMHSLSQGAVLIWGGF